MTCCDTLVQTGNKRTFSNESLGYSKWRNTSDYIYLNASQTDLKKMHKLDKGKQDQLQKTDSSNIGI